MVIEIYSESVYNTYSEQDKIAINLKITFPAEKRSQIFLELMDYINQIQEDQIDSIKINNIKLTHEEIELFILLKSIFFKISNIDLRINCKMGNDLCLYDEFRPFTSNFGLTEFFDVVSNQNYQFEENLKSYPFECRKCLKQMIKLKSKIQNLFKKSALNGYLEEKYGKINFNLNFYVHLLNSLSKLDLGKPEPSQLLTSLKKRSEYLILNDIYKIQILEDEIEKKLDYKVEIQLNQKSKQIYDSLDSFLQKKITNINLDLNNNLGEKIEHLNISIKDLIKNYLPELKIDNIEKLGLLFSIKFLNLSHIFPLLNDPYIEELFLDEQEQSIYIEHQKYGKCNTSIILSQSEIDAIITHVKLESKLKLDEDHPNLIYVMQNNYFYSRISIDIFPNHWKNISLDIRKLNNSIFDVFDLLEFNTLDSEIIVFFIFVILFRVNITIAGEINSGKTTLLNALDLLTPSNFRKIYVEDTIETIEIPYKESFQLKYISQHESKDERISKERDIYQLLHRSGDYIFLGEILTKEETRALFHCLSVGLRGIQTTHSRDIKSLLNRWIIHYSINKICLNDLGIVVIMKKIGHHRIIQSISEINYDIQNNLLQISPIFRYDPKDRSWKEIKNFLQLKFVKKVQKYIYFSEKEYNWIKIFLDAHFDTLLRKERKGKYNSFKEAYSILFKKYPYLGGI